MQHVSQPGQVLLYKNYQFEDGSVKDKLFVVMYVADITSPCLLLKTTSQSRRYMGCQEGCDQQKKALFIPSNRGECFPRDTYIQLPEIFEIPAAEIFAGTLSGSMDLKNALSVDCFKRLKSCLKKFREDISLQHWKLIL